MRHDTDMRATPTNVKTTFNGLKTCNGVCPHCLRSPGSARYDFSRVVSRGSSRDAVRNVLNGRSMRRRVGNDVVIDVSIQASAPLLSSFSPPLSYLHN